MSRRRRWAGAVAWAYVAAMWPSVAVAAPQSEQELLERIEELRPRLEQAKLQMEVAERRRALEAGTERTETVLVRVGPIRIVTVPQQAELAKRLFRDVWQRDFAAVRESPSLAGHVFTFRWGRAPSGRLYVDPASTGGAPVRRVELNRVWVATWSGAESWIRDAVWSVLRDDLPDASPTRLWLENAQYAEPAQTYRALATESSDVHRACLGGDAQACVAAAGLEDTSGAARTPSARDAKVGLLWYAIQRGGTGAWGRAIGASDRSPAELLTAASGLPLDDVAAGWRDTLATQRLPASAGLGSTGWRVLLWFLALATLATRSKRWRVG